MTCLALALVACGDDEQTGDAAASAKADVRFQVLPNELAGLPVLVMQEEGIDERHGFNAETVEVDPDAAANTLLIGESDVATDQDGLNLAIARNEGHEVVAFAQGLNMMTAAVAAEDLPADDPEGLRGKRVGHFGIDSGTTTTMALMIKEIYGIDIFEEYDLKESGFGALPSLLAQGDVDAIFHGQPFALQAALEAPGKSVFEPCAAWREHAGYCPWLTNLAATERWLKEHPELAVEVRDAWEDAIDVIVASDYELLGKEPYKSYLGLDDSKLLDAFVTYCRELPCFGESWSEQDLAHLREYLGLFVENGLLLEQLPEDPVAVRLEDYLDR